MDDFALMDDLLRKVDNSYFGKYRGFVEDTADPERRGRLRVTCPSVLGQNVSTWALPCFPYGGGAGFGMIAVPPVGSQVVVEFMEGDLRTPLWTGTFWRTGEDVPSEDMSSGDAPTTKLFRTEAGHVMAFEDHEDSPHMRLTSAKGAEVLLDPEGSLALTGEDGATVVLDSASGELRIEDANGNRLVMSSSGIEASDGAGNTISTTSGGIEVSSTTVTIKGQAVNLAGTGGESLVKGESFMQIFNTHTHPTAAPGAPTLPPVVPMTPAQCTTATRGS